MRTISSVLIVFLFSLMLLSCQKEISLDNTPGGGGGSGSGSGTVNSYQPLTTGTWWKYKDSASGTISTSSVINASRTINSVVYKGVSDAAATDTGWMASPQPNYYIAAEGQSPNSGAPYDIVFHYLNDTASVGYNWVYNAGQGNGFTAIMKTTIVQKNLTMIVQGKTYSNVIHSNMLLSYNIFGSIIEFGTYDYFTAKGVGIIKIRSDFGVFQSCSDLVDHLIK